MMHSPVLSAMETARLVVAPRETIMGIPATGKKASIGVTLVYRFRDGKVVEEIEDADFLGLFMQLGLELKPAEVKK